MQVQMKTVENERGPTIVDFHNKTIPVEKEEITQSNPPSTEWTAIHYKLNHFSFQRGEQVTVKVH